LPEKLTKFPEFYTILPENARLHNKTTTSRPGRGQIFEAEAEAEAKILASTRGLNITDTYRRSLRSVGTSRLVVPISRL